MMKIKKEGFKLISTFFLVLLVIILVILGRLGYKGLTRDDTNDKLVQNLVSDGGKRINKVIESVQKIPQDLAYILEFLEVDNEEMNILLKSVISYNDELFGSAIAFEPYQFNKDSLYFAPYIYRSGKKYLFTNLTDPEYDYLNKDWYLVTKTLNKPTWSEPYFDEGGGNLLMSTYSVPFYSFNGEEENFKGVVTVDVSIEWLTKLFDSVQKDYDGCVIIISENGTIIYAPNKEWIYNETIYSLAAEMKLTVLREIGRDLKKGKSGSKILDQFEGKKNWRVGYTSLSSNKWGILYLVQESRLLN